MIVDRERMSSAATELSGSTRQDVGPQQTREFWDPIVAIAENALPEFLQRQRWFPGKDAGEVRVSLLYLLPMPGKVKAAIACWRVATPTESSLILFVPLAVVTAQSVSKGDVIADLSHIEDVGESCALVEAFVVDDFVRDWAVLHLEGAADDVPVRVGRTAGLNEAGRRKIGDLEVRRSKAEQSNTSIRIGNALLKVIRKLEVGPHPELEMSRYLSRVGFQATPTLLGWIETTGAREQQGACTLSLLHEFARNRGDGWHWVLEQLANAVLAGESAAFEELNAWIAVVARRTAEMHAALARSSEDEAFNPETVTAADLDGWISAAREMADTAIGRLQEGRARLPPDAVQLAEDLGAAQPKLARSLSQLTAVSTDWAKTRHHGDFHLGQVLVVDSDAMILDFEGEPLRDIALRRAKHCVLRDVAGMMRSFAYAAQAAARALPKETDSDARREAQLRLDSWQREACRTFADVYFEGVEGIVSVPGSRKDSDSILRFFLLEKALYELSYELANRPDWIEIPLRGILDELVNDTADTERAFGPSIRAGSIDFRLWAPAHASVSLELDGSAELIPMSREPGGWHRCSTERAAIGSLYRFVLPDGQRVPDPASRYQPQDIHGPSEVIDPLAHRWSDDQWAGRPWEQAVLYELHVGAFTPAGTFRGVIDKLEHLQQLGVTGIELMPVADFPGKRNWGYDGVCLFAPDSTYGRPEDLKALVDAAHSRGIMVFLDVVYNHFGPEGAYIHVISPQFFTDRHCTPWGAAINTDGENAGPVREFIIQNAMYWVREFHLDGLRLDAVHAILDDGPKHLLDEIAERVRAAAPGRHIHLILENEANQARRLQRHRGQPRWYTAQWNDDVHHVLHVAATDETDGYYADYHADTDKLGRALAEGFAFQGEMMPYSGHARGEPSADLPPTAFVAFLQNHDQIGNRAFGDRLTANTSQAAFRAVTALYLLLPQIPMLFMGEEWTAPQPFPFFCDFEPELAAAVRKGRREEFARFPQFADPRERERIPDPTAEDTFAAAKLDWSDTRRAPYSDSYERYRRLLSLRTAEIVPRLAGIERGGQYEIVGPLAVLVRWQVAGTREQLVLEANLSNERAAKFQAAGPRVLCQEGQITEDGEFAPYSVRWSLESAVS